MPEQEIEGEADRLLQAASQAQIPLRLLGGLAIKKHCPSASHRGLARKYPDIDFVGHKKDARRIRELLVGLGYEGNKRFNALYGDKRLLFYDTGNERQIDVFLDVFEMCHSLYLGDRLTIDPITIPLADLLFTKLQIVQINEKDVKDIIALVRDHTLAEEDGPEAINVRYLADLCANDWGIYRTFTENLKKVLYFVDKWDLAPDDKANVREKLETMQRRIEEAPKTLRWRMRARVGERVRWYEPVEDAVREAVKLTTPENMGSGGKET